MPRSDQRSTHQLRPWRFETQVLPYALGSVMVSSGQTRILCACSVEERQPPWMSDPTRGWIKAEYAMLPCSTPQRHRREQQNNGRNHEIQRLIGRALRGVTDLTCLGPRTLTLDCDVLVADAGTRTASITGGWVAAMLACARLREQGRIEDFPFTAQVAAVSLGLVDGQVLVDLDYSEDSRAGTDLNLVMTSAGQLVEIQGTAEGEAFSRQQLNALLDAGWVALEQLFLQQREALGQAGIAWSASP